MDPGPGRYPADPIGAERWRDQVRHIVAYRDRHDITDTEPVPQTPARGIEETARTGAHAAAETLRTEGPYPRARRRP